MFNTVLVRDKKIGGLYVVTFFHIASLCALVVTFLEQLQVTTFRIQQLSGADAVEHEDIHQEHGENEQTETTPLIRRGRAVTDTTDLHEGENQSFWILGYLLLVPFPVILVTQMGTMLLGALPQTLADGSSSLLGTTIILLKGFL